MIPYTVTINLNYNIMWARSDTQTHMMTLPGPVGSSWCVDMTFVEVEYVTLDMIRGYVQQWS